MYCRLPFSIFTFILYIPCPPSQHQFHLIPHIFVLPTNRQSFAIHFTSSFPLCNNLSPFPSYTIHTPCMPLYTNHPVFSTVTRIFSIFQPVLLRGSSALTVHKNTSTTSLISALRICLCWIQSSLTPPTSVEA